jgi:hypothetical protein
MRSQCTNVKLVENASISKVDYPPTEGWRNEQIQEKVAKRYTDKVNMAKY